MHRPLPDTPLPADVDECSAGRGGCPQRCVNTAGSYWCQCWEGHSPSADGAICLPKRGTARVPHPHPTTGRLLLPPPFAAALGGMGWEGWASPHGSVLCVAGAPEGTSPGLQASSLTWAQAGSFPEDGQGLVSHGHCGGIAGDTSSQPTDWKTVPSGVPSGSRPGSLETPHLRWRRDIITFGTRCDTSNSYRE